MSESPANDRCQREDEAGPDFLRHPVVQAYVALRAFGVLAGSLDVVRAEIVSRTRPGARVLAVVAGSGAREARLAAELPDRAFVLSPIDDRARAAVVALAAASANIERTDVIGELQPAPCSVDVATALWSLSRLGEVRRAWRVLHEALRPQGAVLVQDYVGPPRLRWPPAQIEAADRALASLPPAHTAHHRQVTAQVMEAAFAEHGYGAAEGELIATCREAGFSIPGYASAGCALLHPVLLGQIETFDPASWEHSARLAALFKEEARLMGEGVLGDELGMFVAQARAVT
jgi:hypothetical protein